MKLVSVSNKENSCYIWFQQAFNDKVVIACYLGQYWQIFSSFLIFCYIFFYHKLQNMRTSENISHIALDIVR